MSGLLTSKQVEEILKVNRITIYRMLKDGRLNGVKIGKQWRFREEEIRKLIAEGEKPAIKSDKERENAGESSNDFPTHCVQIIQDLCADLGNISMVIYDLDGNPQTSVSQENEVCKLLSADKTGSSICQGACKDIVKNSAGWKMWTNCPNGISIYPVPIEVDGKPVAMLFTGFQTIKAQKTINLASELRNKSGHMEMNQNDLLPVNDHPGQDGQIDQEYVERMSIRVSEAISGILAERLYLVDRLQKISEISTLK